MENVTKEHLGAVLKSLGRQLGYNNVNYYDCLEEVMLLDKVENTELDKIKDKLDALTAYLNIEFVETKFIARKKTIKKK